MNILVLNDTHFGSNYALSSEDKLNNSFQKWVYPKYQDLTKYCQSLGIDYLITIGDIVDGYAGKDSTSMWTTDVHLQVECAVNMIKKLINDKTIIIGVGGSGYHRGKGSGFDGDRMVVEQLGGKYNKNNYYLNTPRGVIQFNHVGKNIKTELNQLQYNNGELDFKVKLLVNGHLHRYEAYEKGSVKIVHCPCWQYPTDFMQGYGISAPVDIGCLVIRVDEFGIDTNAIKFPIPLEVIQEMSGWEDMTEKQIKERNKNDLKLLSQLSGVSPEIVQVIRNTKDLRFNVPPLPELPDIKIQKETVKKLVLPK